MRVVTIGDVHGLPTWRDVVAAEPSADLYLFIGDYFDAFDIDAEAQRTNFDALLAFRQNQPAGRVRLLLGNHDYHYLSTVSERYSGYQFGMQRALRARLDALVAEEVLAPAAYVDGRLYTHAGVTATWARDWDVDAAPEALPEVMRALLARQPEAYAFQRAPPPGYADPTGDDAWQGPLWVRPRSLRADPYCEGQIFGHTVLPFNGTIRPHPIGFSIDALFMGQYVVVDAGEVEVRRISGRGIKPAP